jgi:glucose-6-phosphate dehydrogenase assembly protein OpcA
MAEGAPHDELRSTDHTVWAGQGVTPDDIEGAMRELERERYLLTGGALPARALNLIVIVDAAFEGEIVRRLDAVGRNAPSRTIFLRVAPHRTRLNARVALAASDPAEPRPDATLHERVKIDVGDRHVARLESIVDPVVMTDVPTLVWAPHGHRAAFDAVVGLSQSVLLDTTDADRPAAGLDAVHRLMADHTLTVVDLAWLRVSPWRLRLAAHYGDPRRQAELQSVRALEVRHDRQSAVAGWLLAGWFADRLGWTVGPDGIVAADGASVRVELSPVDVGVQGLSGATVVTGDGDRFSLDRCDGGLRAHQRTAGRDDHWMVLGASRGEAGVLSAAFRRILVPDDGYVGALAAARALACSH